MTLYDPEKSEEPEERAVETTETQSTNLDCVPLIRLRSTTSLSSR